MIIVKFVSSQIVQHSKNPRLNKRPWERQRSKSAWGLLPFSHSSQIEFIVTCTSLILISLSTSHRCSHWHLQRPLLCLSFVGYIELTSFQMYSGTIPQFCLLHRHIHPCRTCWLNQLHHNLSPCPQFPLDYLWHLSPMFHSLCLYHRVQSINYHLLQPNWLPQPPWPHSAGLGSIHNTRQFLVVWGRVVAKSNWCILIGCFLRVICKSW